MMIMKKKLIAIRNYEFGFFSNFEDGKRNEMGLYISVYTPNEEHAIHDGTFVNNAKECKDNNNATEEEQPDVLILFIKADAATSLIETIKTRGCLYHGAETPLYVCAMKMWVGTEKQYSKTNIKLEFNRVEISNSFVPEYDYVVMKFKLEKNYSGFKRGEDSYARNQFFSKICIDNVRLIEYSKRLSFEENMQTDAYDIY